MTQVDGLSLPVRLPIDGDAFDAACEYARIHDLTISAAASEMLRSFAPSVEQGLRPPAPEDGREGSGEPPASLPSVLEPVPGVPGYICTTAEGWCGTPAVWWCRIVGRPGRACCDDHIPDGWVKPSDTIATPLPHVHITDKPCGYGDRCGR